MGKLIVESVTVEGFGSFTEPQTLTLGGGGVVGLTGANGAGKSTIASKALTWCLYGKAAPERMGSGATALRGRALVADGATRCTVTLALTSADGHAIEITRTRTKSSTDAITVTHSAMTLPDSQATIDGLIGAGYDVFVRTCVRGQNDPWNFAEATDAKKREILDVVSGADALAIPYEKARKVATERKNAAAIHRTRLADARTRLDGLDLDALRRKVAAWDTDQAARTAQATAEVQALTAHAEAAQVAEAAYAGHRAARDALKAAWPTLDAQPYQDARFAANGAMVRANGALSAARNEARRLGDLVAAGRCPTCGQAAGTAVSAQMPDEAPLVADLEAKRAHMADCDASLAGARQWLADRVAEAEAALSQLPEAPPPGEVAHAVQARDAAIERAALVASAANPWTSALDQGVQHTHVAERDVAVLTEAVLLAERQQALADHWVSALHPKGVRADLAESALVAVEGEANRWLTVLSGGKLAVRFPSEKTTKAGTTRKIETLVTVNGQPRPHLNLSGGEKRRINLAVDLGVAAAFSRGGALALSLLVLDEETFSGLDDEGKAGVAQAIAQAGVADVVVIDHDPRLADVLPRVVRVARHPEGDYSTISEQGEPC